MRILAIDPGSRGGLGWAVMDSTLALRASGVEFVTALERDDRSALWLALANLLQVLPADCVAYERVNRHSGVDAAHMYGGQVAVIQLACATRGVPWETVSVPAVKSALRCRASGKAKERAMVSAAHALGYTDVKDHNEADAVGICLAAHSAIRKRGEA